MYIARPESHDNSEKIVTMKINDIECPSYQPKMGTPKDVDKFIKKVCQFARGSSEYKEYIRYLKQEVDMTRCSFFPKVDTGDGKRRKTQIEIHHEPFGLYDIAQIVTNKWVEEGYPLNHLEVAEEVMKIHYQGRVGLIPLIKTIHQLTHRGEVIIPVQKVYGNFVSFLKEYSNYISDDLHDMLKAKVEESRAIEHDYSVLERKYVYLEVEGIELPKPIQ